jgi:hypothetical protein
LEYSVALVTGRSVVRIRETVAQLATETKTKIFTPLDLNTPASMQPALTLAGVEAAQATPIGHHRRTAGLLHSVSN